LKMNLLIAVIFLNLATPEIFAQWKLEPLLHSQISKGINLILKQEYRHADSLFREVINCFPDHPSGYLYRAAVMQAHAIDFDVPIEREYYDSLLQHGREKTVGLRSAWSEYFLATADGYEAYELIDHGDWFDGVRKGLSSAETFETLIEDDSSFYDAYVGAGTYYYWSSRKTAFLRWLPFVKDNRDLGIKMLIAGAEHSVYNRFAAISALVSIFLDAEDYTNMEKWSRCGLESYPENRVFLWGLVTSLDRQNRSAEAVVAYTHLLENIKLAGAPHPYGEIVCRLNLVKAQRAINDTTGIVNHLHSILSYRNSLFPEHLSSRVSAKFSEAQTLLSELTIVRRASK
jgi:hypothetical protein